MAVQVTLHQHHQVKEIMVDLPLMDLGVEAEAVEQVL
jgi:hypothetical protein